ncbi:zinc finger and BTB domain-containing protein 40 isoform X6 [Tympanuchus pallidicinctus]|uniref:zinc finger and BTB domain-containing protein 40 isoform X6 n=1 Tax=Tympanuchus pallidicinctus TaxID=109042 RepID=UPI002286D877|nr:zinc finger and BTB domain-containing protein 40 isoform X6 [Tympanuchus pallidicinctus]
MELPSYSKQLLQQLYTLCKEQQFCDCTIFVGTAHFRAHKVVLAAASLLFKSLLDSTDTISIDASVVTPEEFALLLEMMYTGKLPTGKHNFTKVIFVSDSLQMFDVAVSCKTLLRELISCSTQDQVEVSAHAADSSGSSAGADNLPQSEKPAAEGRTDALHPSGPGEAEMEADISLPEQELTVNHTWLHQDVMLSSSGSLREDSGSGAAQPACPERGCCVEVEPAEPLEKKGRVSGVAAESKSCKLDFFLRYESVFSEALSDAQAVLRRLEECREIDASQREVVLNCCEGKSQREAMDNLLKKVEEEKTLKAESLVKLLRAVKASFPGLHLLLDKVEVKANVSDGKAKWSLEDYGAQLLRRYQGRLVEHLTDTQTLLRGISAAHSLAPADREAMEQIVKCETGSGGFISLVSAALEEQSLSVSVVWQLLLAVREAELPLNVLMEEIQKEPGAELFFQAVATSESTAIEIILRHSELISEAIKQRANMEGLAPGEAGLTEAVKELLSISAQKKSSEASLKAALSTAQEKSVPAIKICQLLCNVHESFPDLQPVMQELGHVGLLTEGSGEKPGIRKWKVNSESQVEALDKEEDKAGGAAIKEPKEPQGKASSKKNFICKACEKSFHFYCRLKVHMKRCRVARGKQIQCKECTEVKSTKKELEKHQLEVHGEVGMAKKKKKKRLPVTCDICGREFAHASGMQYHKLTEHFDEKPFSCEKCGAKFAANSTLKNHLRLHTGDRPFVCKHCLMTFMQASALAYHTKKKHSEGKMYACQYCDAVFAQSIELSRHVRTHTGDKPYVCRECGKGFRQANGLSIHLRSFHNIEDPYDCRKCRMSFATLQEHRKHIHEVHSREFHPCPDCSKVFSAPSLLERHMVTHVGGKPFSCGICNKAYQQLSGLWYHNRTHHPDVFAAQNHRSSKFSSLQCSSCDKTFSSTAAHRRHVKAEHSGVKFHDCEMCKEQFPTLALLQVHVKCRHSGALQHHVTTEHFKQAQSTFTCGLCGELFTSQGELEGHCSAEHPKVIFTEAQTTTAQIVQVIQTSEQGAAEHIISFDEAQLTGSQVFVTLPESQASQAGLELVTVSVEDLFDDKVTLICEETK